MKISQLYIYPIKSLRGVSVPQAILTDAGLENDRRFMLLKVKQDGNGNKRLQNMHVPHFTEMCLFLTDVIFPTENTNNGKILITYRPPDAKDDSDSQIKLLEVPMNPDVSGLEELCVTIHQSPTKGYNMGTKYNNWFSECFGYEVVLVYLGPHWRRVLGSFPPGKCQVHCQDMVPVISKSSMVILSLLSLLLNIFGVPMMQRDASMMALPNLAATITVIGLATVTNIYLSRGSRRKEEKITFADTAPYMLVSETSVEEVSSRLAGDEEMDLTKFRPNIVVTGAKAAYEEDFWAELLVGGGARLLMTANCIRCQSVNVDYATGKMGRGESGSVFKKLMKDRRVDKGAKFSPVFGRYGFLDQGCKDVPICVGDEVHVSRIVEERTTYDWPGLTN
ncbi:MOSC domain-containing protein [Aspergillus avenaceus]|uniref:MOSC domain-containing protein n=1 Tax=Aspergillus avenaceus TaxID=36643 RepID=A0A5N6TG91_ASPAV|nr:MOSC domain-containing protein [Aspergillus avenaceus]